MNKLFILFTLLTLCDSFMPSFKKNNSLKLYSNKKMDLFDKFEKYSRESNKEMQDEYLFKIHEYLSIKTNIDNLEEALLEENEEKKDFFLKRINKFLLRKKLN